MARSMVLCACMALVFGCLERDIAPLDPHVSRFFERVVGGNGVADVDLLFVIDDSGSMREEQESLRREIPLLVEALANPPLDATGRPQWNAVESLSVAIVTTNVGTRGHPVDGTRVGICTANGGWGDGGALVENGACETGSVHTWRADSSETPATFAARIGCIADVGIDGCGLEQPLAAAMLALDAEEAFPRADSLLAVIVLSDEEDCSFANPAEFFGGTERGRALNQRCALRTDLLDPIDGVVGSLLAGRDPDQLVFAALVGVPEDLADASFQQILDDPRMQYRITEDNDIGLEPACRSEGGLAAPGRRYVELASRLDGALIRSICAESFQPAILELAGRIGGRVRSVCANRSLIPDEFGAVTCEVRETLPADMRCSDLVARTYLELDESGREVCVVDQAVQGRTQGWTYDVTDPTCEQVRYTEDSVPPLGVEVTLQCLVEVEAPVPGDIGS